MLTKLYAKASGWWHADKGSTGVEYAVLVAFIGIAVAIGAVALGPSIQNLFTDIGNAIGGVAVPAL